MRSCFRRALKFSVVLTHVEEEAAAAWGRETQLVEASAPHADEYESPNDLGFWRVDIEDQAAFICNELDLSDEQALYLLNALGLLPEGAALPDFRGQPEGQQQYEQELEQQQGEAAVSSSGATRGVGGVASSGPGGVRAGHASIGLPYDLEPYWGVSGRGNLSSQTLCGTAAWRSASRPTRTHAVRSW